MSLARRRILAGGIAALGAGVVGGRRAFAAEDEWKPHNVEVVVGVSPGGSMDRTARELEAVLWQNKFIPRSSVVLNKPGGGHAVALAYTSMRRGNGNTIQMINTALLTNKILGRGTQSYGDITPLANMFFEQMIFAVQKDSKVKDGMDLIARIKADPSSLSFAVSSGLDTMNELAVLLFGQTIGVDPRKLKPVSFNSASEGTTSVLGKHVDVLVTTPFSVIPFMQSGDLRPIAIACEQRLGGALKDVPTWREVGADVVAPTFRVVIGPPGLKPEQIAYWSHALSAIGSTPPWQKMIETNFLTPAYMSPEQTTAFLKKEASRYTAIYKSMGVI